MMSELIILFKEKLNAVLPGAIVLWPDNGQSYQTDSDTLAIRVPVKSPPPNDLDSEPDDYLCVLLPTAPYAGWPAGALQQMLTEILSNCELRLALGHQQARYEAYLQQVKTTKEKLLPDTSHRIEGLEYATHYAPSIGGGGDYFDIVDLRNARRRAGIDSSSIFWGISLFDVSGHGPGSAVEVAMIDAILRTYQGGPGTGPGNVMTYLNQHFFTRQRRGDFVTGLICHFDAGTGVFTYANAGHLPVIVKRDNGDIETLDDHEGIPVGIDRDMHWETRSLDLKAGDTLVMMTDGITEARSKDKKEFGHEAVVEFLKIPGKNAPKALLNDFLVLFSDHIDKSESQDDETLIIVQLTH